MKRYGLYKMYKRDRELFDSIEADSKDEAIKYLRGVAKEYGNISEYNRRIYVIKCDGVTIDKFTR